MKIPHNILLFLSLSLLIISCGEKDSSNNENGTNIPLVKIELSVDSSQEHQVIDGFGAMNLLSNWGNLNFLSDSEMDLAYGYGKDKLGLNIMRIRISPRTEEWEKILPNAKSAYNDYGALLFASPWSPPASMKTNNSVNGVNSMGEEGFLKEECYDDYALYLESFAKMMKDNDAPLTAISIQNEPDWKVDYEGCTWTPEQELNFIKNYGHMIESARLTPGESLQLKPEYYIDLLNDPECAAMFDIVPGHIYGGGTGGLDLVAEKGKKLWMTEYNVNDPSINNYSKDAWNETMDFVRGVNTCLLNGYNAYIFWYLKRYYSFIGDGERSTTESAITPRGYAFRQFSHYIRKGYTRIDISDLTNNGIETSAYKGDGKTVAIVINSSNSSYETTVNFDCAINSAESTYTSNTARDESIETTVNGSSVTLVIEPKSITSILIK